MFATRRELKISHRKRVLYSVVILVFTFVGVVIFVRSQLLYHNGCITKQFKIIETIQILGSFISVVHALYLSLELFRLGEYYCVIRPKRKKEGEIYMSSDEEDDMVFRRE